MSGFANSILGGEANLIRSAIRSPNFQQSPLVGWSIDKNGNAYFQTVTIGGGVVRVTFASSAPASPNTGDVWFDTANGTVSHWNGSAWTNFQYGTGAIGAGAVGTAQISFTARNIGGITTSVQATAPAGAVAGDLWFDTSNGNKLNQYNGASWQPYQYGTNAIAAGSITAGLIAANTITAAQLAAGIVYAGIVDGTTITGSQFVAHASAGEILVYSGTPAAGNLIASISASSGTDPYGNAYLQGTVSYGAFGGGTLGEMLAQQTEAGKTTWYSAPSYSGPWTQFAALNPNNTAAAGYTVLTGQPLLLPSATAIAPGTTATPETWHPMSLNAGWAAGAGYATPSYRLTSGGDVELCGRIVGTSIANGQGIASLPAGYYGATIYQASPAVISAAAAPSGGGTFRVQLGTGGGLVIAGLSATGNYTFQLDGVIIPVSQG